MEVKPDVANPILLQGWQCCVRRFRVNIQYGLQNSLQGPSQPPLITVFIHEIHQNQRWLWFGIHRTIDTSVLHQFGRQMPLQGSSLGNRIGSNIHPGTISFDIRRTGPSQRQTAPCLHVRLHQVPRRPPDDHHLFGFHVIGHTPRRIGAPFGEPCSRSPATPTAHQQVVVRDIVVLQRDVGSHPHKGRCQGYGPVEQALVRHMRIGLES